MDTHQKNCTLCPRKCSANRTRPPYGFCQSGIEIKAALAAVHNYEEPSISGTNGSGAIFISGCNMRCVFCQNFDISHENKGISMSPEEVAKTMISLQNKCVHNINIVSGGHFLPQIKKAIHIAKSIGLEIPIIYNSNGYEETEALKELDGLIDIYLPDIKYHNNKYAVAYSASPNYFSVASKAVLEMYRQTGKNVFSENGLMKKGIIIRHMVIPGLKEDSKKILMWIKENLGNNVFVSLMSQYTPMYKANELKEINRKITTYEYQNVIKYFFEIGLKNGYMQERSSASDVYTPKFDCSGLMTRRNEN
ncbi:MAG: radical SAM protein [Firmicutes bacterium]|nr:radical SAM protein [Bacillota bacterium]